MTADIKDILYSTIDRIGKEKIRMEITAEIERSERCCDEIIENCKNKLDHDLDDEGLATLCEALLHFMLTASVLPSERKVNWRGSELDLVVPSLKMLSKSPGESSCHPNNQRKCGAHKDKTCKICAASRCKYLDCVNKATRGRS